MDNAYFKLGLDYESIYAYVLKQNPDIRTNLQLNPVFIYTKFWTVSDMFFLLLFSDFENYLSYALFGIQRFLF